MPGCTHEQNSNVNKNVYSRKNCTQTQKHYFNFMVQHTLLQSPWWTMISLPSTEGVFVCVHMLERNLLKRYGYETSWQQFPSQDPLWAICSKFLFAMLKTQRGEKAVWGIYRGKFTLTPPQRREVLTLEVGMEWRLSRELWESWVIHLVQTIDFTIRSERQKCSYSQGLLYSTGNYTQYFVITYMG